MSSLILNIKQRGIFHSIGILLLVLLIGLPFIVIVYHLVSAGTSQFNLLSEIFESDVIFNSLYFLFFVIFIAALLGISTAWFISQYDFPGKKFLSWALILPITVPTYIMAFTYVGILNYTGTLQGFLKNNFGESTAEFFRFDVITPFWLVIFLALSLYPYVYLASRVAFSRQSSTLIEAGRSMGKNHWQIFFKIALPLARPAIIGGCILVGMEVLNDYGAMAFFGISTFTTSIVHAWQVDIHSALVLSSFLFITIFLLILLERYSRMKKGFSESSRNKPLAPMKLSNKYKWIVFSICALPFLFGFMIPVLQLISWFFKTYAEVIDRNFFIMTYNSFTLALISALITTIIAIFLAHFYTYKRNNTALSKQFVTIGYAIPGAIIAVGILIPAGSLGNSFDYLLIGTIPVMIYAFVVRFLAVAYNPIEASFEKNAQSLRESSRSLGKNKWLTLLKIETPVIRTAILSAVILVFVDILKELPLTMILRPFDFPTLATNAFTYAKINESVMQSSSAALIIIFIGAIPVLLLHRLMNSFMTEGNKK